VSATQRISQTLDAALTSAASAGCPPRLAAAVRQAVFPGGARIRPHLCLAVAMAHGDDDPALSNATAAALELLHCASLVHDDLPCFDDAATRRGQPTIHRRFGERLAVLAGDALIVLAFETVAAASLLHVQRLPGLLLTLTRGVGMPLGITAGQAWECEAQVPLREYHQLKTGALFAAATMAGAQAAGADPQRWRLLGERLGEAYQLADDIRDVAAAPDWLGKPVGRDAVLGRPSVVREFGVAGAVRQFQQQVEEAVAAVPSCAGAQQLRDLVRSESERLVPTAMRLDLARAA
jgi:geranylgeranyl diphosphate synthase, type II